MEEVTGAWSNLVVKDAGHLGKIVVNTHINDAETETMLTAEHVDASPTLGEIDHLLPCHFAWRNTDPFTFDTVVTTEKEVAGMSEGGSKGLLGKAYLHGKGLETTQRAFWLIKIVYLILDEGTKCLIRGLYVKCVHIT